MKIPEAVISEIIAAHIGYYMSDRINRIDNPKWN